MPGLKNGLFWYKDETTYLRFREIVEDKAELASPYQAWVQRGEKFIKKVFQQRKIILIKINADPNEFALWCKVNACPLDHTARKRFAAIKAHQIIGQG